MENEWLLDCVLQEAMQIFRCLDLAKIAEFTKCMHLFCSLLVIPFLVKVPIEEWITTVEKSPSFVKLSTKPTLPTIKLVVENCNNVPADLQPLLNKGCLNNNAQQQLSTS